MKRNRKAIIATVLVAIVAVTAIGAIAIAQADDSGSPVKTLTARVAAILGIDQQRVEDAFTQAQKDMQNEALDTFLKNQVEQGNLTQEQAGQYKQWWLARPNIDGSVPGMGFGGPRGFGHMGGGGDFRMGPGMLPAKTPANQSITQ